MVDDTNEERNKLVALAAGNFEAFDYFYKKYNQKLYLYALKLSKNEHEAEELVQSVFVSVWEAHPAIDPAQPFAAYLFSIARNRFYDMLRKRIVESCYIDYAIHQEIQVADDLEKQIEDNELLGIIRTLLQQVPARRLEIFQLSRDENLTYRQIAEKLQISENTVDTQIRHVLNFLRTELKKYY